MDDVFEFSASSLKRYRECPKAWGYTYIEGKRSPPGAGAALGTLVHGEMERWVRDRVVPEHALAKALVPLAPHPSHGGVEVEKPIRMLFPVGAARGFVDVFVPEPDAKYLPDDWAWSAEIPLISDYKTTKNIADYALTEDDLRTDIQAIFYGIAARVDVAKRRGVKTGDVDAVDLQWSYVQTAGKRLVKPTRLRQTLAMVEDGLPGILDTASASRAAKFHGVVNDLDGNTDFCEQYGGCSFRNECPAYAQRRPFDPVARMLAGLKPADPVVSVANGNDLVTISKPKAKAIPKEKPVSSTLERLKNAKKKPMSPEVVASTAPPAEVAPAAQPPATAQTVTPEPELQAFDTSGLDVPLDAPVKLNPPDAVPNLTPETAPTAEEPFVGPKSRKTSKPKSSVEPVLLADSLTAENCLRMALEKAITARAYDAATHIVYALSAAKEASI